MFLLENEVLITELIVMKREGLRVSRALQRWWHS